MLEAICMITAAEEARTGLDLILPPAAELIGGALAFIVVLFLLGKFAFPRIREERARAARRPIQERPRGGGEDQERGPEEAERLQGAARRRPQRGQPHHRGSPPAGGAGPQGHRSPRPRRRPRDRGREPRSRSRPSASAPFRSCRPDRRSVDRAGREGRGPHRSMRRAQQRARRRLHQ